MMTNIITYNINSHHNNIGRKDEVAMRAFTGNIFIFIFLFVFSIFFTLSIREYTNAKTIDEVLEENVNIDTIQLAENSIILDRNGEKIADIYSGENRVYLPYEEIPSHVIHAFIATEDQSFFEHKGFDLKGITRALLVNMKNESIEQGASTITQQLARNLFLTNEKTYERKLSELMYAYKLEKQLSKEDILEKYINSIYFQNGTYGIEAASQFYFNKSVKDLSLAETAFLCAIPNNPNLYNPLKNMEKTDERKEWILTKMLEEKYIDKDEFDEAISEEIVLNIGDKADFFPDYTTYVYEELKWLVGKTEGFVSRIAGAIDAEEKKQIEQQLDERVQALLKEGIIIETSLDPTVQTAAVQTVNDYLSNSNLQGATAVIDHKRHEIVAITGGKNYKKFDFHRGFQAYRQPGSAIKPLLAFAPYIEETGSTEQTIIDASPFTKNGYTPKNYGGVQYGPVPMQVALKHSYNTAAVRLFDSLGPQHVFEKYMEKFDFQRIVEADYNLPSALGGFTYGVSVLEMAQAFTSFMTDGVYYSPKAIKRVTDKDGNELYAWPKVEREVWSKHTATEMKKMLRRVVTEGTARQISFRNSSYIGGKTGTSDNYYDLWFVGSTDRYTSAVWLGYDEPRSVGSGIRTHLHIWSSIMGKIH